MQLPRRACSNPKKEDAGKARSWKLRPSWIVLSRILARNQTHEWPQRGENTMEVSSYTANLRDMEFVLFEQLKLDKILETGPYAEVTSDDVRMILEAASDFASTIIAPVNAAGDRIGCSLEGREVKVPEVFRDAWTATCEQGWISLVAPQEYGGQGLPMVLGSAVDEMIIGANAAFHTFLGLCRAAANLLIHHADDELKATYVPHLLSGEWQGTMCLTEADAGSDVGASTTKAEPIGDGTYRIKGTKVFITCGDHQLTSNHIHLVLARLPDAPAGVKGLSLFLVPKYRLDESGAPGEFNDVLCSKIEEKMGIHGSVTTVLNFGDNDDCRGYLIGREGEGIRCMFHMMNEERIVVGLQGQALAAAMYNHALKYAGERIQGSDISKGKSITEEKVPIIRHPDVRRMLMTVRALAEGGRALLYYTSLQQDLAKLAQDPDARAYHEGRLALLTPVCKAWASDSGVEGCSQALQIFGGSGFISDFPAEQYLRDVRIATIYEGTNGIQALDLLFRKVLAGGGRLFKSLDKDISDFIRTHREHPYLKAEIGALEGSVHTLRDVTHSLGTNAQTNIRQAALGATPYLTLFGNVAVAWLLLDQAVLATAHLSTIPTEPNARRAHLEDDAEARFYAGKVDTARFFVHQVLSQNKWKAHQILADDSSALDVCF